MTLQPLIDVFNLLTGDGWMELPESYGGLVWGMSKGAHKYLKRVPKPGGGYRYFYHVGHGGGIHSEDHFVPGASFKFDGGHYHIKSEEGGKLTIEHDETKERKTVSKSELREMLVAHHEPAIKAHREKVAGMLAEARANKASPKQIARLEERAKAAGASGNSSTTDEVEEVLSEVPEYQRRAYRGDTAKELRARADGVRKLAAQTGDDDPLLKFKTASQMAERRSEKIRDAQFMEKLADAKERAESASKKASFWRTAESHAALLREGDDLRNGGSRMVAAREKYGAGTEAFKKESAKIRNEQLAWADKVNALTKEQRDAAEAHNLKLRVDAVRRGN